MKRAIEQLRISLEAVANNEPIHRAEGDIEQADSCLEAIADYQRAIEYLSNLVEFESLLGPLPPGVTD